MNVSYRWLQSLAPTIREPASAVAERLTYTAVPVDEVVWLGEGLGEIVVGRVAEVTSHPNADRLVVCVVDIGGEPVQVVTGAPSVIEGGFYPFIGVGASLPGGLNIKRAKLRGVYSEGMLCSERELGLGRDHEGIMLLRGEYVPGTPLVHALDLDDHRLVLDVTANRPDLLGHWGVARELAPGGIADLQLPDFPGHVGAELGFERSERESRTAGVTVRIEDPDGCPRYLGAVVRGLRVGPSPEWLASRLRAVGQQPINNVVDATNYVLQELNQPLHAFDLARLGGSAVVIRRAARGEVLRTLDGKDRKLDDEMLVIADAEVPTALAGVMGGEASEVTEDTVDVFFECAYFNPKRVRHASKALGLDTDASYRFRRGMDPVAAPDALKRLVELTLTLAGGSVDGAAVDVYPAPRERRRAELRLSRVSHLIGVELSESAVQEALEPIGFEVSQRGGGAFDVEIPSWRPDVEREVDLIEEVARRCGYGSFPDDIRTFRPTTVEEDPYIEPFARLRDHLAAAGFLEAKTTPFAPAGAGEVQLANPLSEREDHLRADLLTELVHRVEYNFARGQRDVRLFELGTAFASSGGPVPDERIRVAAAWTGRRSPAHWTDDGSCEFDSWDLKWIVHSVASLAIPGADIRPVDAQDAGLEDRGLEEPYVAIDRDGQTLGWAGRLRRDRVEAPPWAGAVWGLEMAIVAAEPAPTVYRALPVFPAVERDVALVVPRAVLAAEVEAVIRAAAPAYLETLTVFDVYEGGNIPDGKRSIAWRLRFRSGEGTLTDQEIDAAMQRITSQLQEKLDVGVRGN